MPATEQYSRDQNVLNQLFAASGVVLLGVTIWMFAADHNREWKEYQSTANDVERAMNRWKQLQSDLELNQAKREEYTTRIEVLRTEAISEELIREFKGEYERYLTPQGKPVNPSTFATLDSDDEELRALAAAAVEKRKEHEEAAKKVAAARAALRAAEDKVQAAKDDAARQAAEKEAADADARLQAELPEVKTKAAAQETADSAAAAKRIALIDRLNTLISTVAFEESLLLSDKKFAAAEFDAARATLGLLVRDNAPAAKQEQQQAKVKKEQDELEAVTLKYQAVTGHRLALANLVKRITDAVAEEHKKLEVLTAEKKRLEKSYEDLASTWFVDYYPGLGKKWLELPIIDAFNSPLKIDNQHLPKLTIQLGSFKPVARYDRCTTCHQLIDRSLPGQPTTPAYVPEHEVVLQMEIPPRPSEEVLAGKQPADLLRELYGIQVTTGLAATGSANDVVINYIARESRAATARVVPRPAEEPTAHGTVAASAEGINEADEPPGMMVGDVLARIGPDKVLDPTLAERFLLETVKWGKPLEVTIRRGLKNPYVTHPRLDLYMSSVSPHPLPIFGCTICHEGQGSATAFKFASHAPNDKDQERRWKRDHGWFDNHHWIFPQYEARFLEATCIKCHHQVVELERSEKFLDPPAPKVTRGHELIRRYGCFGCHEINGFDGTRRIGPDMRLEPNFFAIAQQFTYLVEKAKTTPAGPETPAAAPPAATADAAAAAAAAAAKAELIAEATSLVATVVEHPDDTRARDRLRDLIEQDQKAAQEKQPSYLPPATYDLIGLLRDPESAGTLRRVGPSLRFVGHKLDESFLYDWIANPSHFRPTTLMPKFFGNWTHLDGEHLKKSQEFEPLEVLAITKYLKHRTQPFAYEPKSTLPEGAVWKESTAAQKAERGKQAFELRGCLACHNHQDFPRAAQLRGEEVPQGPDLTGLGTKFSPERNKEGREWLYSWVKNPTRYHARTKMPVMFLNPTPYRGPLPKAGDAAPAPAPAPAAPAVPPAAPAAAPLTNEFVDPAEDIVEYLLTSKTQWQPPTAADLAIDPQALNALALENLKGAFAEDRARTILNYGRDPAQQAELSTKPGGIAENQRATTKGIETELIGPISEEKKLLYIGRKAINKYGCFGCHDIPGFEEAKPIGTGLTDWGRKNPVMLAFGHIGEYFHGKHEGHSAAAHGAAPHAPAPKSASEAHPPAAHAEPSNLHPVKGIIPATADELDPFYEEKTLSGTRIGFIGQKLNEPRSYDYKDLIKPYNDRLRMPKFPMDAAEREAVVTFVLGLVADPPHADYLFNPKPRRKAELDGRVVLEKYNCGGCHILEMDRWKVAYKPGDFPPQGLPPNFPFLSADPPHGDPSVKPDAQGNVHGILVGAQSLAPEDAIPAMLSGNRDPISTINQRKAREGDNGVLEDTGPPETWAYPVQLYQRKVVYDFAKDAQGNVLRSADGAPLLLPVVYEPAEVGLAVGNLTKKYPSFGGFLVRLNAPRVLAIEKAENEAAAKLVGKDTWSWLPPPLFDEGTKVEFEWLHNFLLDPYPIRPAVVLRMPKFNMSADEASALVNYFAARDGAEYPYVYDPRKREASLEASNARFLAEMKTAGVEPKGNRLDQAMRIVAGICIQCHKVGDFTPDGDPLAQAPNLADVHRRLQRGYLKRWIADPKRILPYTTMPVNFPYKPYSKDSPLMGGETLKDLYHGTSIDQIDAVVDLLVNYDQYTKQRTNIKSLVEEVKKERAAKMPPPAPGAAPAVPPPANP